MPLADNEEAVRIAKATFGTFPSVTVCGNHYAVVEDARLYLWDEIGHCFRLLLSIPQLNGSIDLVTIPEPITNRIMLKRALSHADRQFRVRASWPRPSTNEEWGFEVEALVVKIFRQLGFEDGYAIRDQRAYTVRLGTYEEDHLEKADIILTMPNPFQPAHGYRVPLQVTTSSTRAGSKREAIIEGRVAFINISRFILRGTEAQATLRGAATGKSPDLWYVSELLRGAVGNFIGRNIQFPKEPECPQDERSADLIKRFRRMLLPEVRDDMQRALNVVSSGTAQKKQLLAVKAIIKLRSRAEPYMRPDLFRLN